MTHIGAHFNSDHKNKTIFLFIALSRPALGHTQTHI